MDITEFYQTKKDLHPIKDIGISFTDGNGEELKEYPTQWALRLLAIDNFIPRLVQQLQKERKIIFLSNALNFIWAGIPFWEGNILKRIIIVGPVSLSGYREKDLYKYVMASKINDIDRVKMLEHLIDIPVMAFQQFKVFVNRINYVASGGAVNEDLYEFMFLQNGKEFLLTEHNAIEKWAADALKLNGKDIQENTQQNLLLIEDDHGLPDIVRGKGEFCPWNSIRQKKDEAIIRIAFLTKGAIAGGAEKDLVQGISNRYIQAIEISETPADIDKAMHDIRNELWKNIQRSIDIYKGSKVTKECCQYIQEHIKEKLGASEIAAALGYSKYYLTSRFKKEMGISMSLYIQREKVEMAQRMLQYTDYSLDEVSEQLSFTSKSYFIQVFKKNTGTTPKKYSKETSGRDRESQ